MDSPSKQLFGTDGIRGLANEFPMTSEIAMSVGRAIGYVLQNHPEICAQGSVPAGQKALNSQQKLRRVKVVLGKDTRLANYMIESAMVSGLCSMGVDVYQIGPMTTPGVAFITQSMRADAGIMISASHNPYYDTGIKIFQADGYKFSEKLEQEIEDFVQDDQQTKNRPVKDFLGKAYRIDDAIGRYVVYLKSYLPKNMDLQGIKVALDCANGAAYKVGPLVFEELGAEMIKLGISPNGLNINLNAGALFPNVMSEAVSIAGADIGIALDGDGDRCILCDENGEIVDGDQIIGLCALQMAKEGTLKGNTVVTTPMTNSGLEKTLKDKGISMIRVDVGDRHVVEALRKHELNLGGEQSGHVIFLEEATTGDGILAALNVLKAMIQNGKKLSELKKEIQLFHQAKENIRVVNKEPFENHQSICSVIESAQSKLKDRGRVFVRYSGTEPLARVLVEGEDKNEIQLIAKQISTAIETALK